MFLCTRAGILRGRSRRGLYGDTIEEIDWSAGRILETLGQLGIDDNTLVVFTSENGPWLSQKLHGGSAGPFFEGNPAGIIPPDSYRVVHSPVNVLHVCVVENCHPIVPNESKPDVNLLPGLFVLMRCIDEQRIDHRLEAVRFAPLPRKACGSGARTRTWIGGSKGRCPTSWTTPEQDRGILS